MPILPTGALLPTLRKRERVEEGRRGRASYCSSTPLHAACCGHEADKMHAGANDAADVRCWREEDSISWCAAVYDREPVQFQSTGSIIIIIIKQLSNAYAYTMLSSDATIPK
jgi:hypothetical protein